MRREANADHRRWNHRMHGERGRREVIKIKSMTTEEIGLNAALEAAGITPLRDRPCRTHHSAGRRPALAHRRSGAAQEQAADSRDLSARDGPAATSAIDPRIWPTRRDCTCARSSCACRRRSAERISSIAETGGVCVVESEGNGRMCLTLPDTLITIAGIERSFRDFTISKCCSSCCRASPPASG